MDGLFVRNRNLTEHLCQAFSLTSEPSLQLSNSPFIPSLRLTRCILKAYMIAAMLNQVWSA